MKSIIIAVVVIFFSVLCVNTSFSQVVQKQSDTECRIKNNNSRNSSKVKSSSSSLIKYGFVKSNSKTICIAEDGKDSQLKHNHSNVNDITLTKKKHILHKPIKDQKNTNIQSRKVKMIGSSSVVKNKTKSDHVRVNKIPIQYNKITTREVNEKYAHPICSLLMIGISLFSDSK